MPLKSVLSLVLFHMAGFALVKLDGFEMAGHDMTWVS